MPGDINGFDPLPGPSRYPGADFWPGPYSLWATPNYKDAAGHTTFADYDFLAAETRQKARYE